jgi:carbamoyltransferase
LCHRSILANPTFKENLNRVNIIKNREFWRPLAPVMLEEDYYDIVDAKQLSPFMLIACEVKDKWRAKIPATTHIDNSCRPQSINSTQNKIIHSALFKFKEISGVPVFMNTSFNVAGEPLVDSPQDAINTFFNSDIDVLMLGKYCIFK